MQPTTTAFEPREDLGLMVEEIDTAMQVRGFIGHRLLPIMPRDQSDGKVPRLDADQLMQEHDVDHAAGANYNRVGMEFSDDQYSTKDKGIELSLDDRTRRRFNDIVDAEQALSKLGEYIVLSSLERTIIDTLLATGSGSVFENFTSAVGTPWSDTSATIIQDVDAVRESVLEQFGEEARILACSSKTLRNIANSDQVVDRSKGQSFQDVRGGRMVNVAAVAAALDLDTVIETDAVRLNPSGPTPKFVRMFPNDKAILMAAPSDANGMPRGVGRTVIWSEEGDFVDDRVSLIAETYYEEQTRTGIIRRRTDWGLKFFQPEAGHLLTGTSA